MKYFDNCRLISFGTSDVPVTVTEKPKYKIDWSTLPNLVRPYEGGQLPIKRAEKKCQQLENLAHAVIELVNKRDSSERLRVVDFCSGGGHLAILLAYLMPQLEVYLVENKPESLERALNRVQKLQLKNCRFFQGKALLQILTMMAGVYNRGQIIWVETYIGKPPKVTYMS